MPNPAQLRDWEPPHPPENLPESGESSPSSGSDTEASSTGNDADPCWRRHFRDRCCDLDLNFSAHTVSAASRCKSLSWIKPSMKLWKYETELEKLEARFECRRASGDRKTEETEGGRATGAPPPRAPDTLSKPDCRAWDVWHLLKHDLAGNKEVFAKRDSAKKNGGSSLGLRGTAVVIRLRSGTKHTFHPACALQRTPHSPSFAGLCSGTPSVKSPTGILASASATGVESAANIFLQSNSAPTS